MALQGGNIKAFKQQVQRAHQQVPKIAAVEAERYFMNSFKKEAWEDEKWKKRKREREGVKRTDRRALLVKTGRLMRGFQRGFAGKYAAMIVNATPYAEVHNEGLRVKATQHVRAHHRRAGTSRTQVQSHIRKVDFRMPQRQFMGNSHKLNLIIRKKIVLHYARKLK